MSRRVSGAERALWRAYVALNAVEALPGHALPPPAPPAPPEAAPAMTPAPTTAAAESKPPPRPAPLPELRVGGDAPPGLDARRWKRLRRGDLRPERRLDLHGRRVEDAHAAVHAFLRAAHAEGVRCVEVVTGKGGPVEPGGVLRRELPHWLNGPALRPLVLGAAHPHPGNLGAVLLLLRRRREKRPEGGGRRS